MKRNITNDEFQKTIAKHLLWLHDNTKGQQACFENINFTEITFDKFDLSYVHFDNCEFSNCKFHNVKLKHSYIYHCVFNNVQITKTDMSNCDIFNTSFLHTVISNSVLTESVFNAGCMKYTRFVNITPLKMKIEQVALDYETRCSVERIGKNHLCCYINKTQINLLQDLLNSDNQN